ncbi:MAG: flagellar hook-basal body complex protein FliE [Deltaproteobacteria bacterium]|nr:flagellar hook-basal body complex protein FliE [Deltaproteobacteria bacterium]
MATIDAVTSMLGRGAGIDPSQGKPPVDQGRAIAAPGLTLPDDAKGDGGFAGVLAKALDGVNAVHGTADVKAMDMVQGKDVPIHDVMAAVSEAEIAVQLTTAIASKAIAAYQEIWRMDV